MKDYSTNHFCPLGTHKKRRGGGRHTLGEEGKRNVDSASPPPQTQTHPPEGQPMKLLSDSAPPSPLHGRRLPAAAPGDEGRHALVTIKGEIGPRRLSLCLQCIEPCATHKRHPIRQKCWTHPFHIAHCFRLLGVRTNSSTEIRPAKNTGIVPIKQLHYRPRSSATQ